MCALSGQNALSAGKMRSLSGQNTLSQRSILSLICEAERLALREGVFLARHEPLVEVNAALEIAEVAANVAEPLKRLPTFSLSKTAWQ